MALLEEFQGHQAELINQHRGHELMLDAIIGLVSYAKTGVYNSSRFSIDKSLFYLRIPNTTDFGSGVRDALISSGRIEIISDKKLRYEIAGWFEVTRGRAGYTKTNIRRS